MSLASRNSYQVRQPDLASFPEGNKEAELRLVSLRQNEAKHFV
jgi:hypothetical protein